MSIFMKPIYQDQMFIFFNTFSLSNIFSFDLLMTGHLVESNTEPFIRITAVFCWLTLYLLWEVGLVLINRFW